MHSAVGISRLQITGDVTVQAVVYFSQFGVDLFGSQLFYFSGQQPDAFASENALWGVGIRADADRMVPNTFWESPPNTFLGTRDVDFTVDTGRWYHIVGVRDGVDASLYVNGALISGPSTVATAPTGGTSSRVRVGEGNDGVQGLLNGTMISSLKVSDRVLTAREIQQEFNRVRSAT